MSKKSKRLDLDNILKQNPHIHKKDVAEGKSFTEQLRKDGIQRRDYQLAQPFGRRQAKAGEGQETDPRTINLSASRY